MKDKNRRDNLRKYEQDGVLRRTARPIKKFHNSATLQLPQYQQGRALLLDEDAMRELPPSEWVELVVTQEDVKRTGSKSRRHLVMNLATKLRREMTRLIKAGKTLAGDVETAGPGQEIAVGIVGRLPGNIT